jgi:hypothetical protein
MPRPHSVAVVERGNAVVIAGHSLAVDDAGTRAQAGQCLDDQGKTITGEPRKIIAGPSSQAGF